MSLRRASTKGAERDRIARAKVVRAQSACAWSRAARAVPAGSPPVEARRAFDMAASIAEALARRAP